MKNKIGTMILAAAAVAATGAFAKDDAEAALKARLPEIFAKAEPTTALSTPPRRRS